MCQQPIFRRFWIFDVFDIRQAIFENLNTCASCVAYLTCHVTIVYMIVYKMTAYIM